MRTIVKKSGLTLFLLSVAFQSFAQEGRWYSLEESSSSTPTGIWGVITLVMGIVAGAILIKMISISDTHSKGEKGCLITFFVISIALAVIVALSTL